MLAQRHCYAQRVKLTNLANKNKSSKRLGRGANIKPTSSNLEDPNSE